MGVDGSLIQPVKMQIYAFDGSKVNPTGTMNLLVYTEERTLMITFFIIDTPAVVNTIMGREWIHSIEEVVSTLHQLIRCSSPNGHHTIDIKGDSMRDHEYFNLESTGKIKRLSQEHLDCTEKNKGKAIGEEAENPNQ